MFWGIEFQLIENLLFERGKGMKEREILERDDFEHNALIVSVTRNWNGRTPGNLYAAARYSWPVKKEKVEREIEIVLACAKRQIVGVFIPTQWHTASDGDSYFDGHEADREIQDLYVGKYLNDDLRFYGGSVRYVI